MSRGPWALERRFYSVRPWGADPILDGVPDVCPLVHQLVCGMDDTFRPDYMAHRAQLVRLAQGAADSRTTDPHVWAARVAMTVRLIDEFTARIAARDIDLRTVDRADMHRRMHVEAARARRQRALAVMAWGAPYAIGIDTHDQTMWGAAAQHALYSLGRAMRESELAAGHRDTDFDDPYPPETARINRETLTLIADVAACREAPVAQSEHGHACA